MYVIDPLIDVIEDGFESGDFSSIVEKRDNYGNSKDILRLSTAYQLCRNDVLQQVSKHLVDARRYIFVDLSPFTRIGNVPSIVKELNEHKDVRPVLLYMSAYVDTEIHASFSALPIVAISFNIDGSVERIFGGSSSTDNNIRKQLEIDLSSLQAPRLANLRRWISQQKLVQMLALEGALYMPVKNSKDDTIIGIAGRYYKKMANQMLITSYLDIKHMVRESRKLLELAYEAILELQNHFMVTPTEKNFDLVVVPNNTALFIGSVLQSVLGKPVIPIDRLGPIPRLPRQRHKLREILQNQRCVVFEEVVATGSELDRTLLFLKNMDVHVVKIVALYNLEIGRSMMAESEEFISLCHPKQEIGYVYRSQ